MKPYRKGLEDLDAILLKALQDQGAKSIRTPSGTVYQRIERSATIKDSRRSRSTSLPTKVWDLLDWRANKVAVFNHMEREGRRSTGREHLCLHDHRRAPRQPIHHRRATTMSNDNQMRRSRITSVL